VGRDLLVSSLQDTDDYTSWQKDISGGVSFTFGTMSGSASLSISNSKTKSEYASVGEQMAGRDGGIGVSKNAMADAWSNPLKIEYVPSKYGPTFKYTGNDAAIVVNQDGKVVTGWAKTSTGTAK